jgi:hypothetical protein
MANNFLMGGKLGDFLHSIFAVKQICQHKNIKADIYMYDIGWEFGIKNTYAELKPILEQQDYINSLNILQNYNLDPIQNPQQSTPIEVKDEKILAEGYIDLGNYIRSPWLYRACWSDIYSRTFDFPINEEYQWIKYDKINPDLKDKVLIQRKANVMRNPAFPYEHIIDEYGTDNVLFVSSTEKDYNEFPYKDKIEFYKVITLDEWFTAINSASVVVANLSAPAVMAHAMDKQRIIELPIEPDAYHCMGEEQYSKNIHWFLNEKLFYLQWINS